MFLKAGLEKIVFIHFKNISRNKSLCYSINSIYPLNSQFITLLYDSDISID